MKKYVVIFSLMAFLAAACAPQHQTWAPRKGKKMKKGHNHSNA